MNYEFHSFGNFNSTYSLVMKVFKKTIRVVARSYFDWRITKKNYWKIEHVQKIEAKFCDIPRTRTKQLFDVLFVGPSRNKGETRGCFQPFSGYR